MQRIPGKRIHVILTEEQLGVIERMERRHKYTRSEAIRVALNIGLDTYTEYEKVGVVQMAEIAKKARKAIELSIQPRLV